MGSIYRQYLPKSDLGHFVDAYWTNSKVPSTNGHSPILDRVLPDGCIDLIFQGNHGGGSGGPSRLFISALIEEPTFISADSDAWFAGIRFRPGMSRVVLNVAPEECRNRDLDASDVDSGFSSLRWRLTSCRSPDEALRILRETVDRQLIANAHRAAPPRIRRAISLLRKIVAEAGGVATVAASLGVTARTLHRDVVQWTGHAPKVLARIFRMQAAMEALRAGESPLATVSAESGYADQAHMTREFRRLTGATLADYLAAS